MKYALKSKMYLYEAVGPNSFLNIIIGRGFILGRQDNSCSCPFLVKIQAIFNKLFFFPLLPKSFYI